MRPAQLAPGLHSVGAMNSLRRVSHFGWQDDPALRSYWRQIAAVPLLPAAEQRRLAVTYAQTRDPALARRLVGANLRLVVKIAHEYFSAGDNFADLVQEGNLGLMRGVEKFDPHRGVKLTSYAGWWIRAHMMRFLMEQGQTVKMGTTRCSRRDFCGGRRGPPDLSLNQPVTFPGGDTTDNGLCRQDLLRDEDDKRPDRLVEEGELRRKFAGLLGRFVAGLERRDRRLLEERWLVEEPQTLKELGKDFSLSGERVRQLEQALFHALRETIGQELTGPTQR